MGLIKSYDEFINENLYGQYSYYGAGSLYPIVSKLATEGKNPQQIYLYLTTLGIDEERKRKVITQVFLNESIDFDSIQEKGGLYEDDVEDILKADTKDLEKGIEPSKAKSEKDEEIKKILDTSKSDEDDEEKEEENVEKDKEDVSTKVSAIQSVLKDAQKLEKIKKILSESMGFDIDGVDDEVLMNIFNYHKVIEALTPAEKDKLKPSDFIFPDKRSWPIHDEKHAKTALVWATWPQYKNIKNEVVSAVIKRYPQLKGIGASK